MDCQELVKDWLSSEGFRYTVDNDGDVQFKYQGWTMWATKDENDKIFLRIIMPGIYKLEESERIKCLEAVNAVNRDLKTIKSFIVGDRVWLSIEIYVDSSPEIEDFFERCLDTLVAGVRKFMEEMRD